MNPHEAVQIVEKVNGTYKLNETALRRILDQQNVMDRKVAIVTVAGAFRKGKSFFLSNCVRYFQCKRDGKDWMDPNASISGFAWKKQIQSVTEGILMWPEPFLFKDKNGQEVAILLMDTEGAFDHKSSMKQCATIFALSALLSSVLVFNVSQDIQEDTLNHLQFFASYGSYALDKGNKITSPFQSLLFLVRDWQNDDEFGVGAGGRILKEKLEYHEGSAASLKILRQDIKRSFRDIKCCLLPNPGDKIRGGSEGGVTVSDMLPEFRDALGAFVPQLFGSLLPSKEFGGGQTTGAEFLLYFKTYTNLFASGEVPEPKSIYDATAEASHQSALESSLDHYMNCMRMMFSQLVGDNVFEDNVLQSFHEGQTNAAINKFIEMKKWGNLPNFVKLLEAKVEEKYREIFLRDNQNRIMIARVNKEKEGAEKKMLDQEIKNREERVKYDRELEVLRQQMAREKIEREEAERRRLEDERRRQEEREKERRKRKAEEERRQKEERRREEQREQERREREEEQRRMREEQQMERERREREKRRQEEEAEQLRKQMEQMRLENERKEKEREEERRREKQREQEERERRAREEERERQRAYTPSYNPYNSGFGSSGYDNFSPSYSNASRSGTPSGRSTGRPMGSTVERFHAGIMPGTESGMNILRRGGYID